MASASAYRLPAGSIDETKCLARRLREDDKDTRWSPAVYREHQCSSAPAAGSDLCAACAKNLARYTETCKGRWNGYITEDPLPTTHMLGTTWAKKCVFKGGAAPSRDDSEPDYDADAEWWAEYIRANPDYMASVIASASRKGKATTTAPAPAAPAAETE